MPEQKDVKQLITWGLLLLCCLLLAGILITLLFNNQSRRYTIRTTPDYLHFWGLDTKTGRIWERWIDKGQLVCLDYGTPEKPTLEVSYVKKTVPIFGKNDEIVTPTDKLDFSQRKGVTPIEE
jgi:hypothetical protein